MLSGAMLDNAALKYIDPDVVFACFTDVHKFHIFIMTIDFMLKSNLHKKVNLI